jgi:thymidylate synthase
MYGLLLEMLAKGAGLKPGDLVGQLGDCHLYNDHLKQAGVYLSRLHHERDLPKITLSKGITANFHNEVIIPGFDDILIEGYDPLPAIPAPLSVGK